MFTGCAHDTHACSLLHTYNTAHEFCLFCLPSLFSLYSLSLRTSLSGDLNFSMQAIGLAAPAADLLVPWVAVKCAMHAAASSGPAHRRSVGAMQVSGLSSSTVRSPLLPGQLTTLVFPLLGQHCFKSPSQAEVGWPHVLTTSRQVPVIRYTSPTFCDTAELSVSCLPGSGSTRAGVSNPPPAALRSATNAA